MQLVHSGRGQAGDTIVEVLIAIAVIGSVLGTAYAILNRAVQGSQQSQEHSRALAVAESQIEQLKKYNDDATTQTVPFCIWQNGVTTDLNNCKQDDGSATGRYNVKIERNDAIYTISVNWEGPKGGQENVSVVYRSIGGNVVVTPPGGGGGGPGGGGPIVVPPTIETVTVTWPARCQSLSSISCRTQEVRFSTPAGVTKVVARGVTSTTVDVPTGTTPVFEVWARTQTGRTGVQLYPNFVGGGGPLL